MERRVEAAFSERKWNARSSVYYKDLMTGKLREIDVLARSAFQLPDHKRYTGVPTVNSFIVCECKSFGGTNILLSEGGDGLIPLRMDEVWIGREEETGDILQTLLSDNEIEDRTVAENIYEYLVKRAYPESVEISRDLRIPLPPVEFIAGSMRETKSGDMKHRSDESSAVWGAISALISSSDALKLRARESPKSFINTMNGKFVSLPSVIRKFAFFYDAELLRRSHFHSVLFVRCPLWKLSEHGIELIKSARIMLPMADGFDRCVDIVSEDVYETYIQNLCSHVDECAMKALAICNDRLNELSWCAGGGEAELCAILDVQPLDD